ncbi:MAG: hypothetical protein ACAI43_20520 [Phycisphaerae bacterium]|nr:hypothetical protein [Tepidisphaeraceae bacterium]
MATTVILDEAHYSAAPTRARAQGQTPEEYIQSLIDADARSFDEILGPVRAGFETTPDTELDEVLGRANRAARQSGRAGAP